MSRSATGTATSIGAVATVGPTVTATAATRRPTPTATTPPTRTPTARPTAKPAPAGPARVLSASLKPATIAPSGRLLAAVGTSGAARRVEMYVGSGAPNAPAPLTYALVQSSPGTWTGGGQAPSVPGQYHFTVGLFTATGRTVVDNDAWNIVVSGSSGGQPPGQVQPLPDDIPLAPGFSWGNPTPAVFSAAGGSVNGSEIASTTRTDITPTSVAQFYNVRLPRAGWNLDQAAPVGAASFTISATKSGSAGTRVCIVQYGGSTIHIFYGTLSG